MASTSGAKASKKPTARKGALAAGAARASGERAKRRSTPLIAAEVPTPTARDTPATPAATSSSKHRPRPVAKAVPTRKAVARSGARTARPPKPRAARTDRTDRTDRDEAGAAKPAARHTAAPKVRALKAVSDDVAPVVVDPGPVPTSRSVAPGIE